MRIAVSGAYGRLGRLLVPWLRERNVEVISPTRSECDWSKSNEVSRVIGGCDAVLCLASYTNVTKAQQEVLKCVKDTVNTTIATLDAAQRLDIPVYYISSDYALAPQRPMGTGCGVYAASKFIAEQQVLMRGQYVARVAFTCPEQTQGWKWSDNLTRANRCWVDEIVPQIGKWVMEQPSEVKQVVHLGADKPITPADLLATRYPDHPALKAKIETEILLTIIGGGVRPLDTSWWGDDV